MISHLFNKTWSLARFIIRRDRVRIPIWLILIALITFVVAISFTDLYPSDLEREMIAQTMLNPAMVAMIGPAYGIDNYTFGAVLAHQMLLFSAIAVAIMNILLVVRHTREDEEEGRIEMIRSLPSGRLANLSSTMLVMLITNSILALLVGFGLFSLGIETMDLEGSMLYGAALGAAGIIFAAITALFAQLSANGRGTIGLSFAALIIAYLIRAIGDVSYETLSWFSPLGWVIGTEAYVNNYWWPILCAITAALLLSALAFYLNGIRDLGAGIFPSKPGRKHASPLLQSPLGLSFRIQRTGLIAWAIGMLVLGASYGSVMGDLDAFFEGNEVMEQMLQPIEGFSITEQFISMILAVLSMISAIPVLMASLKLKGEERRSLTEHLLSRAVSRNQLMGGYLIVSLATSFVMLSLAAFGLWSAASPVMDDPLRFGTMFGAALAYLPAIWVMNGVALLLIGALPKLTGLVWLYLGYSFFVVYLGGILQFPDWMSSLSPFGHIPQLPVEEMNIASISILTFVTIILTIGGFLTYNKRDITG